ncbi:MAG: MiaB/RimO family radical SAM methylthiotransferase [Ruminococcus sp.]|nr:MiaB/RimO family radical SAM methylthiotransferase [Ruminococcus sp.]
MKIYFITFGCKVNICETEKMSAALAACGHETVTEQSSAEMFIVNSCTVTAESDSKLMQTLRRIKRDFPGTVTAVTGCFPQAFPEKAAAEGFPADIIIGNSNRGSLPGLIDDFFADPVRRRICRIAPHLPGEGFEDTEISCFGRENTGDMSGVPTALSVPRQGLSGGTGGKPDPNLSPAEMSGEENTSAEPQNTADGGNVTRSNAVQSENTERSAAERNVTKRNAANGNATERNATERNVAERNVTERNVTKNNAAEHNVTDGNTTGRNATERNANERNAIKCNAVPASFKQKVVAPSKEYCTVSRDAEQSSALASCFSSGASPNSCLLQHTRAFLKIQDGCPNRCAYCIIPKARGNVRSLPLERVGEEAEKNAAQGYREIVLTGINLAFYGCDLDKSHKVSGAGLSGKYRLADAVETVCGVRGIERVRLGSLEPERLTEEDIARLASLPKVCPCFHLSLQSGCDGTLKAMNRRYTTELYGELAEKLRRAFPDCGITTDIMVGFPGETEEDHRESLEFAKRIGFSDVHVFPYSPREGTAAAEMAQVPAEVKKRRAREFAELGETSSRKFRESLVGKRFPVLFEREKSDGVHHGYTPNYVHVKIFTKSSEKSLRNSIFYVTIDKVGENFCWGHIDDENQNP